MALPRIRYQDNIHKATHVQFGGIQHVPGAMNGAIWDMQNMTSNDAPLLKPRPKRWKIGKLEKPNGVLYDGNLFYVDGTKLYMDGNIVGLLTDTPKKMARIADQLFILPDWKCYKIDTGEMVNVGFEDITVKERTLRIASTNDRGRVEITIDPFTSDDWPKTELSDFWKSFTMQNGERPFHSFWDLSVSGDIDGEPVEFDVEGLPTVSTYYNSTLTIRTGQKQRIPFDYGTEIENATITIKEHNRHEEYKFLFKSEDRLWTAKGDTVMASTKGSCFEWQMINYEDGFGFQNYFPTKEYVFGAISNATNYSKPEAPWQGTISAGGDFTAGTYYKGYPVFTKEGAMIRAYGTDSPAFQLVDTVSSGSAEGSGKSFCTVGETLYYLTPKGVVAYGGGIFQNVSAALGNVKYKNAVAGSDGRKYHICMQDPKGNWHHYVYDTTNGLWEREDGMQIIDFWYNKGLYFVDADGNIWLDGDADEVPEGAVPEEKVESWVEFADFIEGASAQGVSYAQPNKKGVSKLQIRIEIGEKSKVKFEIMYDSSGKWEEVTTLTATVKRSYYLPIIPHRCDHFKLRISSDGDWRLNSLVTESYIGSER